MYILAAQQGQFEFFSMLRAQSVPFFAISTHINVNKQKYVSSKSVIAATKSVPLALAHVRYFFIRERDVPLVQLMSQHRVEVLPPKQKWG